MALVHRHHMGMVHQCIECHTRWECLDPRCIDHAQTQYPNGYID